MTMALTRYWFEFDTSVPAAKRMPWVGVTAWTREDAEGMLRRLLFADQELPPISRLVENVDVRNLDAGHVRPNMGPPHLRGIWYPNGYDSASPPSARPRIPYLAQPEPHDKLVDGELRVAVFEGFAGAIDGVLDFARRAMADPDQVLRGADADAIRRLAAVIGKEELEEELVGLVKHCLLTLSHSMLATIDGASASAEVERVYLVSDSGRYFDQGLHAAFFDHLYVTGRLP